MTLGNHDLTKADSLNLWKTNAANFFEEGVKHGVAWEISEPMIDLDPEFVKRFWELGKSASASFNFGMDAHELSAIGTERFYNKFYSILD